MVSYTISHRAYVKTFLHAAKHPHKPVNGVLLGKFADSNANIVLIEDAIPLLHHWTSLSPMMEIGLDLAQRHATASGFTLVGYYQACERLDDKALAPVGEKVASKIRENFQDAVAFVIDGEKFGTGGVPLMPYVAQPPTSFWCPFSSERPAFSSGSPFQLADVNSPKRALALVQGAHLHRKFGDFDDHLEDVTIDWLQNKECEIDSS